MESSSKSFLEKIAKQIRLDCLDMTKAQGITGAHIGGALSLAEIMAVLYKSVVDIGHDGFDENRDRVIMSKGHGAMAMYAAMKETGLISQESLDSFKANETFLYAHPTMDREHGIEYASGSLGQGLSLAVGVSLGLRLKQNSKSRIFVILGDGECDEGSVWEAVQAASHYNCSSITAIVDYNHLQYDGDTEYVLKHGDFPGRWKSYGWDVINIDGHSVEELTNAFSRSHERPLVIIADTVKGKGVSFMENDPQWHNHSLTDEEYLKAIKEVNEA